MHQWRVGTVDVVRVESFDLAMPSEEKLADWAVPSFGPSPDEWRVADSATALRDGDLRIVVDPWLLSDRSVPDGSEASRALLDQLAEAGFPADEVDVVVNTHLDGLGWNTVPAAGGWALAFPNAAYLYPVEDLAWAEAGGDGEAADLRHLGSLADIRAVDAAVALTPAVSVVPSGGHGQGHQVVRIESDGDLAIHLGHLVLHPAQFSNPAYTTDSNPDEITVRRRQLDDLADQNGLALTDMVGGPGGGRVTHDGDAYRVSP